MEGSKGAERSEGQGNDQSSMVDGLHMNQSPSWPFMFFKSEWNMKTPSEVPPVPSLYMMQRTGSRRLKTTPVNRSIWGMWYM